MTNSAPSLTPEGQRAVTALVRPHASGRGEIVLVLESTGDDKLRVNSSSLDHPLVILPDQALGN
jgi:hypothetical protein